MGEVLKAFNLGFLLRSVFSGIFFVISYYVATHDKVDFTKIELTNALSVILATALFAGVTMYGILRSLLYPILEYYFDKQNWKDYRARRPLISDLTIQTLMWRWDQRGKNIKQERINQQLNVWADFIHLQYNSALCILAGATVGRIMNDGAHSPYCPLIILACLLLGAALVSNWRHHSVLDYARR